MGKTDLHTHTNASDGTYSAQALIELAQSKKLETIAITDHDTIAGYLDAKSVCNEYDIELIPGVEITALWNKKEIHILAYLFDPENLQLQNLLSRQKQARILRMKAIVEHLKSKGLDITLDEVRAEAASNNMGRPHLASVLIQKNYVASVPEAFIRYLSSEKLESIQTQYADVSEVIKIINQSGGVTSLAHPGPLYSENEILTLLSLGIDGLECIHPSHNFSVQQNYIRLAKKKKVLVTGGSDFHGKSKSNYQPFFGIVTLGKEHLMALKRVAGRKSEIV